MIKYFLYFLVSLLLLPLSAQEPAPITFAHIGLNDGLSQSTVVDITQDRKNNMWFATHNGLISLMVTTLLFTNTMLRTHTA